MLINTGSRTDVPAFFSKWFYNRIREGYVLVRNPYYPQQVTRYELNPDVVDALVFCTKNPRPMIADLDRLDQYRQLWHVTITPYGRDIEPGVPDKSKVMQCFRELSEKAGKKAMVWRYDPVFISPDYDLEFHIEAFGQMARQLDGFTQHCVISFIDLYEKTKRNFPEVNSVAAADQRRLISAFSKTAGEHGMKIHLCLEHTSLAGDNVDAQGCFRQELVEQAIGVRLSVPTHSPARQGCNCLLGGDIGAYNTCGHGCRYCYANYDMKVVRENMRLHDPDSPLLIGHLRSDDVVKTAKQESWVDNQLTLFDFISY